MALAWPGEQRPQLPSQAWTTGADFTRFLAFARPGPRVAQRPSGAALAVRKRSGPSPQDLVDHPTPPPRPSYAGRVRDEWSELFQEPLGPSREFMHPFTSGPFPILNTFNEVVLGGPLTAGDALLRGLGATYNSGVAILDESLKRLNLVGRGDNRLYRDFKLLPEAFAGSASGVARGGKPGRGKPAARSTDRSAGQGVAQPAVTLGFCGVVGGQRSPAQRELRRIDPRHGAHHGANARPVGGVNRPRF